MAPDTTTSTIADLAGKGWAEHADDPKGVFARVVDAVSRTEGPGDVLQLAALGTHVAGDHLGDWAAGRGLVESLRPRVEAGSDADRSLWRYAAILELCAGGDWEPLLQRGIQGSEASSRIRVLGLAAQALAQQGALDRCAGLVSECEALAAYGPGKGDPAARVLAITGNNLACTLEEKGDRTPDEDRLLERAAKMARTYWEVAGNWENVKIAEYRLAMTMLALGRIDDAERHAENALSICRANDGGPSDAFFCHEARARVAHARGDHGAARRAREEASTCLGRIDDEDTRSWCQDALEKLDGDLG